MPNKTLAIITLTLTLMAVAVSGGQLRSAMKVAPSTQEISATQPASEATTRPSVVMSPTSRPALSPKARALLDAILGNQNTNGQWHGEPSATPDELKELQDGGYLDGVGVDVILKPTD